MICLCAVLCCRTCCDVLHCCDMYCVALRVVARLYIVVCCDVLYTVGLCYCGDMCCIVVYYDVKSYVAFLCVASCCVVICCIVLCCVVFVC